MCLTTNPVGCTLGVMMNFEEWLPVDGYEGFYDVSDLGRVRRVQTGHVLATRLHEHGYLEVTLWRWNKRKHKKLHRLVAEAFIPNPENKPEVNHKAVLEKANNCVSNLEWATRLENLQHAIDSGHECAARFITDEVIAAECAA